MPLHTTKSRLKSPLSMMALALACVTLAFTPSVKAGVIASGFSSGTFTNNGTLPWGAHTDHGSEYYQWWNAKMSGGYLTLNSIYNTGGHRYESGVVYGKAQVPGGGYNYVTLDCDIWFPYAGIRGCWPAFWLTSAWGWPPEVDIAEFKGNTGGNVWQNAVGSDKNWRSRSFNISGGYHHYGLAMSPGGNRSFQLFFDGHLMNSGTFPDWQGGVPFWVICNYAMEGDGGSPGPAWNSWITYHNYVLATH